MAEKRLLALDLSTHTGFAVFERYKSPFFGTWYAPDEVVGRYRRRFSALWNWLDDMRQVHSFDAVAYEEPLVAKEYKDKRTGIVRRDSAHQARLLLGFADVVETWCGVRGVLLADPIPVPTVKRAMTGNSYAEKDEMKRWAVKRGWKISNDDEADAGGVGLVAYETLFPKRTGAAA